MLRCIFVAGLAAGAAAFQPVDAGVRGTSVACRRASPVVALELCASMRKVAGASPA